MNPILYGASETSFDSNGIGILSDAILCDVYQELNGQYELEMQYPVTGLHFSSIANERILLAKVDPVSELQPFRIYRITKPMHGVVTVYARHIAYDMRGITVSPFTAQNCPAALQGMKINAATDCPFEFWTDKETAADMTVAVPKTIWSQLGGSAGSVLDVYGGEYEFDRFTVKLHNRRGADRGVSIRYGKNLTSLEQDENCANVYTGVHPYWLGSDGTLVQLPEKILHAEGNYPKVRNKPLDLSRDFETQPTEEQLRTRAQKYMKDNDIGVPDVSWKVEFVQLEQTEEYKGMALLERVLLGDTVSVEFAEMGVSASARAVAGRYDSLQERWKNVYLGSVRANIADTIVQQQQQIQQAPTKTDLERAKEAATAWLTNGKGYKVERRDADGKVIDTLYMDTPDINTAVNILRIGQSGIGFSHTGVNGPYLSAWTIDGHFCADFMTTGTLNAALVKVINLIADHLLSVKDGSQLEIDGASIVFSMNGNKTMQIQNWDDGEARMYIESFDDSGSKIAGCQLGSRWIGFGGPSYGVNPDVILRSRMRNSAGAVTGRSLLVVDEISEGGGDYNGLKFTGESEFPDGILVGSGTLPIKEIRVGVCHLSCSSKTTVKFSTPMSEGLFTPMVVLTPFTSTVGVIAAKVTAADNTGFTAIIGGSGFSEIYFNYIAFAYP